METWVSGDAFARDYARHCGLDLRPSEIIDRMRSGDRNFSTVFHTPVVKSLHGDSSGVRGAAWLSREEP